MTAARGTVQTTVACLRHERNPDADELLFGRAKHVSDVLVDRQRERFLIYFCNANPSKRLRIFLQFREIGQGR